MNQQDAASIPHEVRPLTEDNQRLLDNVHPAEWANPQPADRYHLVVLGAGTAGLVTAAIAVALGAKVALIERKLMGGDCLNSGCVPSKALIEASRAWVAAREGADRYGAPEVSGEGDFGRAMDRMRRIRADISRHDSAARFRDLGVDVFIGDATFASDREVRVGDATLRFRRAVIATGGRPTTPPIPGLSEAGYLTSETVFSLTDLPRRLLVLGGGPIGCELAQAFAGFGSRVTLLEATDRLLGNDDADAARIVHEGLEAAGIDVRTGVEVERVERLDGGVRATLSGGGTFQGDHLLVATGRLPNVEGLGLETAGVEFDRRRGIQANGRLQTTNSKIFAIGDVTGGAQFTHMADAQARMVVRNALFFGRADQENLVVPWCTYTTPELAHVGVRPWVDGGDWEAVTIPFTDVDRALLEGRTEGFVRIHLAAGSDTIGGATVVGDQAGELISMFTQAIAAGTGLGDLAGFIYPYPTRTEVVRKAADQWNRRRLTPTAKRAMDVWFRLT